MATTTLDRPAVRSVPLSRRLPNIALSVLLGLFALVWLSPFIFVAVTSVRSQGELLSGGVFALPKGIQLVNFERGWRIGHCDQYFVNSLIVTLV